jgi:RNA polymerase sigma-70 factor, ECF subfamily
MAVVQASLLYAVQSGYQTFKRWYGQMQFSIATQLQATKLAGESDEALAVRGDADSFIQLYRRHLRPVYGYLYTRLGNVQEAEDLTAMVFEKALSSLKNYKPTGSFAGWLFTIAHRTLADHYRQHTPKSVPVEDLADALVDPALGPEETAIRSEQVKIALQIIAGLSHEQQEVIILRFISDLRYNEIAQITGKREAAVKMIAYRALEEIRRRYSDVQQ